jgi:hypothetical protein
MNKVTTILKICVLFAPSCIFILYSFYHEHVSSSEDIANGRRRQSLPGGTEENHEIRSQVSQSTDSDANTGPAEYGAVVPTADHCSVLRHFEGSHQLRRTLYHAGRNRWLCARSSSDVRHLCARWRAYFHRRRSPLNLYTFVTFCNITAKLHTHTHKARNSRVLFIEAGICIPANNETVWKAVKCGRARCHCAAA